ncbi:Peptidoglycan/xylan/chitin deacetylase, PgdA/CDA1 family [Reichenbachiella faecimaris]|uniref:Peptidoglycan/xylan/chitin deacetylase, PgdA/CDA1 family n=1 Tax=Reichenbachiella faecimaris TaxID=692418 RepID=A0A1W2GDW5_REIFA|nr:polysaccharide deacetylase family protein [Reichenbachiella faecimaris]SMD34682.1 Peptidoglycan/xylan/chitin deacetylase, PgdA/CDA1 family [Reichenbachiella faecimaris]
MKSLITHFFLIICFVAHGQNKKALIWPNGAKAAICLTYDDGLPSHIYTAAPMLAQYNFKGTFFPTLSSPSIYDDMEKWKSLAASGHELGNHTLYHPCQKSLESMDWVADRHNLDDYSLEKIYEEIQMGNTFLQALDSSRQRTFAYPCSNYLADGEDYSVALFNYATAARDASEIPTKLPSPLEIDLFHVPSWAPNNHGAHFLIAYIDTIIQNETLSTITFHGVGAEHMQISSEAHEELLKYLDSKREEIWVTTFKEATDYLRTFQNNSEK